MARPRKTTADPTVMVGYTRCSTEEQADSGLGIAAQEAAIRAECARRGWTLAAIHTDAVSGKSVANRPGLAAALTAVETGAAAGIVVAKLDRLSRSLADFASLMARAQAGRLEPRRPRPRHRPGIRGRRVHGQRHGLRRPVGAPHHRPAHP